MERKYFLVLNFECWILDAGYINPKFYIILSQGRLCPLMGINPYFDAFLQ